VKSISAAILFLPALEVDLDTIKGIVTSPGIDGAARSPSTVTSFLKKENTGTADRER
jgi:hypothetical protein